MAYPFAAVIRHASPSFGSALASEVATGTAVSWSMGRRDAPTAAAASAPGRRARRAGRRALPAVLCAALVAVALHAPVALHGQAAADSARTFEGSASLGFAQISGNASATTLNVADKIKYAVRGWAVEQDLVFFYGKSEGTVNANFWSGGVRGERALTPRLGVFVGTRFDRNQLQGISSRFEEGIGLSYTMLDRPRDRFTVAAGASMFQQRLGPGTTSAFKRNFPAARVGADYKHLFSKIAFFQQTAEYLPNLGDTEVYFVNTESSLVAPLTTKLGIKLGYVVRFSAAPPVKNGIRLEKTDTFLSSGLTYSF